MAPVTIDTAEPVRQLLETLDAKQSRRAKERVLQVIDISVGLVVMVSGLFALFATPLSVLQEVQVFWLVWLWGGLLVFGGFLTALGRLTGIWILETTGLGQSIFGVAIYAVVVSALIANAIGVVVAVALIGAALLMLIRRYVELSLFLNVGAPRGVLGRLDAAMRRRTTPAAR